MTDQHDSLDELETSLRQLPLRKPSPDLDQRVLKAIASPRRIGWWIGALGGLAAAAMLILAIWIGDARQTGQPTQFASTLPAPRPAYTIAEVVETWMDDGVVGYTADGPVRQYRVQTLEQIASADGEPRTITRESVIRYVAETY